MAAAAGVAGGDEREPGGEGEPGLRPDHRDEAVLERLTERLERVAPELGQFVQEQDSGVRQADFSGSGNRSAADQTRRGNAGMRAAKGASPDQSTGAVPEAGHGVDLRHRDRLRVGEWRQDSGQAPGEHRLAGSWRPDKEDVVAAGRGEFQGPLGRFLAADVREVGLGAVRAPPRRHGRRRREHAVARQVFDRLTEVGDGDHLRAGDRSGLPAVRRRQKDLADAESACQLRDGQGASNGAHLAVEAQFATGHPALEGLGGEFAIGGQQPESDRQVELIAFLAQIRGRQVDDDVAALEVVAAAPYRRPHAVAALPHRGVGQADQLHRRQAEVGRDFDLDLSRLDAPGRRGVHVRDHMD